MPKNQSKSKPVVFSIITPSYQQVKFIEETILSVLTQEGNFKIEHIIADGGSTDGSVEIIKKYDQLIKSGELKAKCKGITFKWWSKPDKGQSDAINQGFLAATGDYTAWLNSDDTYTPGALEQARRALDSNPKLGLVYADYAMTDVNNNVIEEKIAPEFNLWRLIHDGNFIAQPASFMRRKALIDVGLLNPEYHYAMDYDLWMRLGEEYEVQKVPGRWALFRLHEDSKTVSLEKKFWKDVSKASREHGATITSPIFKVHYFGKYPRLLAFMNKIGRGWLILRDGSIKDFVSKLRKNLLFWTK